MTSEFLKAGLLKLCHIIILWHKVTISVGKCLNTYLRNLDWFSETVFSGEQAGADSLLHADGHHARALHPPLLRGRHGPEAAHPGPGRGRGQRGPLGLGQPVLSVLVFFLIRLFSSNWRLPSFLILGQ